MMKQKEKINIYNDFLISLHTAVWTGNDKAFKEYMKRLDDYSYARTNSYEGQTNAEYASECERTLKELNERLPEDCWLSNVAKEQIKNIKPISNEEWDSMMEKYKE